MTTYNNNYIYTYICTCICWLVGYILILGWRILCQLILCTNSCTGRIEAKGKDGLSLEFFCFCFFGSILWLSRHPDSFLIPDFFCLLIWMDFIPLGWPQSYTFFHEAFVFFSCRFFYVSRLFFHTVLYWKMSVFDVVVVVFLLKKWVQFLIITRMTL